MSARAQGFALIAAIILVVILAALAAFVATLVGGQSASQQLERMSRVADLAAHAGMEWGAYRVMQAPAPPAAAPACFPTTTLPALPGTLSGVQVTVQCIQSPFDENGLNKMAYGITATAIYGGVDTNPDYVQRQKLAVFTR